MKNKSKSKRNSKKMLLENSKEPGLIKVDEPAEELLSLEKERDYFSEGEVEDKNIVDRVILF